MDELSREWSHAEVHVLVDGAEVAALLVRKNAVYVLEAEPNVTLQWMDVYEQEHMENERSGYAKELIRQVRLAAVNLPNHLWRNKYLDGIWQALRDVQDMGARRRKEMTSHE